MVLLSLFFPHGNPDARRGGRGGVSWRHYSRPALRDTAQVTSTRVGVRRRESERLGPPFVLLLDLHRG